MDPNQLEQKPQQTKAKSFNYIWKNAKPLIVVGVLLLGVGGIVGYGVWQKRSADAGDENTLGKPVSATTDINSITVQLGREKRVGGPSGDIDAPYFIERGANGRAVGFTGNQTSYAFDVDASGALGKPRTILEKGPKKTDFDGCGAWVLGSIYKVKGKWIGWYHAENNCNYANNGQTHMSMAYMESTDRGKTWQKPNYPNNLILTTDERLERLAASNPNKIDVHKIDDIGNGRIIKKGDYYYAFYAASTYYGTVEQVLEAGQRMHVARSSVDKSGKPGTWFKWYCTNPNQSETCKWNEKGLGGKSTAVKGMDSLTRFVTWNTYLNRYIGMRANGKVGITLRASEGADILNWSLKRDVLYPEVTYKNDPEVNDWTHGSDSRNGKRQLYAYTSIGPINPTDGNKDGSGSDETGREFYLYYVKLYAGQEFEQRNLLRRKVTLLADGGPSRVALTAYKNEAGQMRMSTEIPKASFGYSLMEKSTLGYLATSQTSGYLPVFECQLPGAKDFYLVRDDTPADAPYRPEAVDDWTRCSNRDDLVRRIGWISQEKTAEAYIPLYNCYDKKTQDHFVATRRDCRGAGQGSLLGYMLPPLK